MTQGHYLQCPCVFFIKIITSLFFTPYICNYERMIIFAFLLKTVAVAQLVRVVVCGTIGRGFEPHQPPHV